MHFVPRDTAAAHAPMRPQPLRRAPRSPAVVPARAITSSDADDGLLDEIDFAVQVRSASELRALDDLTPVDEPR